MLTILAAPAFVLATLVLPGSVSRVVGANFAAAFLATTGVVVVPVVLGLTWQAVLSGGCDAALLLTGARLASRAPFLREYCAIWMKRIALLFSAVLFLALAALALLAATLTGHAVDAMPFGFGVIMSGIAAAMLLSKRSIDAGDGEPCGG